MDVSNHMGPDPNQRSTSQRDREARVTHALTDATRELLIAAERNGTMMLTEIAMRQALAHDEPQPPSARG
jgi:hypothetical protein